MLKNPGKDKVFELMKKAINQKNKSEMFLTILIRVSSSLLSVFLKKEINFVINLSLKNFIIKNNVSNKIKKIK